MVGKKFKGRREWVGITEIFRPKEKEIMHLVDKRRKAFGNANVNLNQIRRYPYFARWRSHLFHYRNKRKRQKKTETCSLRSLTCFVIRYAYYTRWRSHLFITEINGKDRKKQKLLPAAGYGNANRPAATLTITLTLTKFDAILILLAGARIFSLQK